MPWPRTTPSAVIANGESLSAAFYVGAGKLTSVQIPSSWTAATITFQGSLDGTNFFNVVDGDGNEVEYQADASRLIPIQPFEGANWMKIRSGTSGTPVNQGAARTLNMLVVKDGAPHA